MSIRWSYALLMLGAVQARSQTLPADSRADSLVDIPALTAAAELSLSSGEALLQSGNYFYTIPTPAATGLTVKPPVLEDSLSSLTISPLTTLPGGGPSDPWPAAALRLATAEPSTTGLTASTEFQLPETALATASAHYHSPVITDGADPLIPLTISNMSVVFIPNAAPVPEPSEWALTGVGLGLFGWLRRRQAAGKKR